MKNNLAVVRMGQLGNLLAIRLVGKDGKGNGEGKFEEPLGNFQVRPKIIDYDGHPGNGWGNRWGGKRGVDRSFVLGSGAREA